MSAWLLVSLNVWYKFDPWNDFDSWFLRELRQIGEVTQFIVKFSIAS